MVAGQLGSEQSSPRKCSDSETLSGTLFFLRPTSHPYQKRQEQNEKEEIGEFRFHRNAGQLSGGRV
jgi:hypothetical protein